MNMEVELVAPLSVGTTADGEFPVPIWKLVNSREFSKFDFHRFFILKPYIFEELSVLLVDTGASVLVFPVSSPPPNSECQCSTENYQRLWQIALQFGSGLFVWTFLLADGSMAILSTEFLCHHQLLVGVAGSCLLDASSLEPISLVSSVSASSPSELFTALLATLKEL